MRLESFLDQCRRLGRKEIRRAGLTEKDSPEWRELTAQIYTAVSDFCRELGLGDQGAAAGAAECFEKDLGLPRREAEALARELTGRGK